jgi:hypothetical protein
MTTVLIGAVLPVLAQIATLLFGLKKSNNKASTILTTRNTRKLRDSVFTSTSNTSS